MQIFKNNFRYGQTAESFAQSMLKGELQVLKEQSLKTCINGTPVGYQGIEQRKGYKLYSLINREDDFVQFPVKLSKTECTILIFTDKIIICLPDTNKYFVTPLDSNFIYDITTIQDVVTNSKDRLFISSSRGIDVYNITNNFQNTASGGNILVKSNITGLDSINLKSVTANVYFFYKNTLSFPVNNAWTGGNGLNALFPYTFAHVNASSVGVAGITTANRTTFITNSVDTSLTNLYIEVVPGLSIGDIVSFTATLPAPLGQVIKFSGQILSRVQGYKFNSLGLIKIYPSTLPPQIATNTFNGVASNIYNIPTNASSTELFIIGNFTEGKNIIDYIPNSSAPIESQYYVRGVSTGSLLRWLDSICFPNANVQILVTSNQGAISNKGFSMYANTDNRLNIAYDNIAKASEVGNLTNFTNGQDNLTETSPLELTIQGVTQIKWIWKLRDRGVIYGTDVGIKLLNQGASSFRLGVIDISDKVPSKVKPVSATINGIGGVVFVNNEQNKILFLASQSTLQTPVEDLTQFVDFFLNDKIVKLVSVQYRSGEMTMVLTESQKVYRLVTGNNDKFGWVEDKFYVENEYNFFSELPENGEFKIWYKVKFASIANQINNVADNKYYLWNGTEYIETQFAPMEVYDISTYKEQLVIIFTVKHLLGVKPVKVTGILDLNAQTTADLYTTIPELNYIFRIPEQIFINNNINLPVYYPIQIDQSFLTAIIQPSRMFLETHYDEYLNRGRSSKTLNRTINYRVINGENLYNIKLGYKQIDINDEGRKEWFEQNDTTVYIRREDVNLNPITVSGDFIADNSLKAPLITCTIQSDNLYPTIIRSEEYHVKFT